MRPPFKQSRCAGTEIHVHASAKRRRPTMDMPAVAIAHCDAKTIEGRCLHHADKAENDGENHDADEDDVDIHVLLTHEPQHEQGEQSGTKPMKI